MSTIANPARGSNGGQVTSFPNRVYEIDNSSADVHLPVPMTVFATTAGTVSVADVEGTIVTWTLAAGACVPHLVSVVYQPISGGYATGLKGVY